mgnify:CR=1 FL=1
MKKEITIIAVSDIKIKRTINALMKSSLSLKPYKTILFSSKKIKLNNKQADIIDLIKVDKINSIQEYSSFIIYKLFNYIQTSHILIVQWDGYVINPEKWDSEFLNYDFIGAPFVPRDNEEKYCRDKNGAFYTVGNGGFSLRSRRLLEAPSKFKLLDNKEYTNFHEDGFFSVYHRSFLESKGYVWAPFVIAKNFSIESFLSIKDLIDLPLGFHGKKIFYLLFLLKIISFLKF